MVRVLVSQLLVILTRSTLSNLLEQATVLPKLYSSRLPLSSANSTTHSSEDPKLEMCALMELNQSYLIVGIPIIILTVEILRHTKTLAFVEIASAFKIIERIPKLQLSHVTERDRRKSTHSTREGGIESERELGRSRRNRRRNRVERDGSEDDSELERLLSV